MRVMGTIYQNICKTVLSGIIACIVLSSCGGGGETSVPSALPTPTPMLEAGVNLGNISTIPLNGNSSNTSVLVTNNLSHPLILQSATYRLQDGITSHTFPVSDVNSPVNTQLCTTVVAHGILNQTQNAGFNV